MGPLELALSGIFVAVAGIVLGVVMVMSDDTLGTFSFVVMAAGVGLGVLLEFTAFLVWVIRAGVRAARD